MELKDLVGEHILDAVDFSDEFGMSQAMRFRLDGKVYTVVEDPGDGYRSSMKEISVGDEGMTNTFQPVQVIGLHHSVYECGGSSDILELIDAETGETIIEVGTDNETNNYYPIFVASFHPEAMRFNYDADEV